MERWGLLGHSPPIWPEVGPTAVYSRGGCTTVGHEQAGHIVVRPLYQQFSDDGKGGYT